MHQPPKESGNPIKRNSHIARAKKKGKKQNAISKNADQRKESKFCKHSDEILQILYLSTAQKQNGDEARR